MKRFYNNAVKIFGKLALTCRRFCSKCSFTRMDRLRIGCHSAFSKKSARCCIFLENAESSAENSPFSPHRRVQHFHHFLYRCPRFLWLFLLVELAESSVSFSRKMTLRYLPDGGTLRNSYQSPIHKPSNQVIQMLLRSGPFHSHRAGPAFKQRQKIIRCRIRRYPSGSQ